MVLNGKWLTPLKKQCFVTFGVCLNVTALGSVLGYTTVILPQLIVPGSIIPIDDTSGSWIASLPGFAFILGNIITPTLTSKFGRKGGNLISIALLIIGWFLITIANHLAILLIARVIQGISVGICCSLGPLLIGEYTSPKNRGAFLSCQSLSSGLGVLVSHSLGIYLTWQWAALVLCLTALVNLIIVIYSPESPSWLADHGKYEKSKAVFRWLRGYDEEEELKKMIEASVRTNKSKADDSLTLSFAKQFEAKFAYINATLRKKEFYKPVVIMSHIYAISSWGGANTIAIYSNDILTSVLGADANIALVLFTLDIQRMVSNIITISLIKKFRRKIMLIVTIVLNVLSYFSTAGYVYARDHDLLPFDHPAIGVFLLHSHVLSIGTGVIALPSVLAGEIFPLEYRSTAGSICTIFYSSQIFFSVKSFLPLISLVGFPGTYIISGTIVGYSLVIAFILLPETKDRTLQDIEDEFRGKSRLDQNKIYDTVPI